MGQLFQDDYLPRRVRGTRIRYGIPFTGNGDLFNYQPSHFTLAPPEGEIVEDEIQWFYDSVQPDQQQVKRTFEHNLGEIKRYIDWIKSDIKNYNEHITQVGKTTLVNRKSKVLGDMGLVQSLGVPIKHRDAVSDTYTIPITRKRVIIELPKVPAGPFQPEPTISNEIYESILEIMSNMSLAMERSPQTFSKLHEEEIRDFFLLMLNAHFEGRASGETFNFAGKTDILIRENNRNVFIAECKIWSGEKNLLETIDQLLGYLSWRDTKTAIILFNRNQGFGEVLEKIKTTVPSHKYYKAQSTLKSSKIPGTTVFPFIFKQPMDLNKELSLTIMAFDVPV